MTLLPKTMFARLVLVVLGCLVIAQAIFFVGFIELGRPMRAQHFEQPAVAPGVDGARQRPPEFGAPELHRGRPFRPSPLTPGVANVTIALLVLMIGGYFVTRQVTRPLSRLAEAADQLGTNVRAPPVAEEGPVETQRVAQAFNIMRERIIEYLDSRTEMLAAMSHDLRTPLTRMRLRIESIDDEELRQRFVADLAEMEALVQSTLELLRGQGSGTLDQRVIVRELLEEIAHECREAGERVELFLDATGAVVGDRLLLKRMLVNVIGNALKFGGQAEVRATLRGRDVVVCVRDEGPGIPEADLPRVFEPFYRVESSRNKATGGVGLGLAIARQAAHLHHGRIALSNRLSGGLEVEITLPLAGRA